MRNVGRDLDSVDQARAGPMQRDPQRWNLGRIELLSQTAARLLEAADPQAAVEELCRDVLGFLDCHAFFNYLVDAESGRLRLNAFAGIPPEEARAIEWLEQGQAVCGCVARDRRPIVVENVQESTDPLTALARKFGLRAYCGHPMIVRGQMIGTLSFGTRGRGRFNADEVGVMRAVTDLVAMAMHRIRTESAVRESEARLRLVTDAAPALISYVDGQGRYRFVNKGYETWFARSAADIVGRHLSEVIGAAAHQQIEQHVRAVMSGRPVEFEVEVPYPAGSRFVRANYVPDVRSDGSVAGFFALVMDITDNKRTEEALRVAARQQRAVAAIGEFSLTHGLQETFDFATRTVAETLEVEYCKVLELLPGGTHMFLRSGVGWKPGLVGSATVDTGMNSQAGYTLASNEPVVVFDLREESRFSGPPLLVDHGVISGMSCVIRLPDDQAWGVLGTHACRRIEFTPDDISFLTAVAHVLGSAIEHRRAAEAMRESEQRLRLAMEAGSMGSWEWDIARNTVTWSAGLEKIHGLEPGTFAGTFEAYQHDIHPDDRERVLGTLAESLKGSGDHHIEYRIVLPDGRIRWVEGRGKLFHDATGGPRRMVGVCVDITQRKHAHDALRASEERFRSLVSVITDVPWTMDPAGAFVTEQRAWAEYTGQPWAEHRGMGWVGAICPEDREALLSRWAAARDSGSYYESRGRVWHAASGQYRHVVARAVPQRGSDGTIREWVGCCTDIDDQVRSSERLEQTVAERTAELEATHQRLRMSERMASLGTLSAGLGHDMGNLLVPVRVRLESLEQSGLSEAAREDIAAIRKSAEYLQRLANGLRLLSLDPSRAPLRESTDLREWWSDAQGVMRSVLPRGVTIEARLPEGECPAAISKSALTQAVFNLVQNAGDAVRDRGCGRISITAACEGSTAVLAVADDGPGMTPEVRARCMEPFFTTKSRGISTGLGLPLVYGLVSDAGGSVDVESEPGHGTRFVLRLPLAGGERERGRASTPRCAVVEIRDARLRSFVAGELKALDYSVIGTDGGGGDPSLFVVDNPARLPGSGSARAVLLQQADGRGEHVVAVGPRPSFAALRDALRLAANEAHRASDRSECR